MQHSLVSWVTATSSKDASWCPARSLWECSEGPPSHLCAGIPGTSVHPFLEGWPGLPSPTQITPQWSVFLDHQFPVWRRNPKNI